MVGIRAEDRVSKQPSLSFSWPAGPLFLFLAAFIQLFLSGCVTNRRPTWKEIPDQLTFVGVELSFKVSQYVADPEGGPLRFKLVSGPGTLDDEVYRFRPTVELLGSSMIKFFDVVIRAFDNRGAYSDVSFKVTVLRGPELLRTSDFYLRVSERLSVNISEYVKFDSSTLAVKLSDLGTMDGTTFTFVAVKPGSYQIPFLIQRNGIAHGLLLLNIFVLDSRLTLHVAEYNAGPAVGGARAEFFDESGAKIGDGETDINGCLATQLEVKKIVLSKPGHSRTVIHLLGTLPPLVAETTLRRPKFSNDVGEVSITFELRDGEDNVILPDASGIYHIRSSKVRLLASASSTNFGVSHMYAKVGGTPGAEFLTSPRAYAEGNSLNTLLDLSLFAGSVPLFIDAYDDNDNRTTLIVPLRLANSWNYSANTYVPEVKKPFSLRALTIKQEVRFYSLRSPTQSFAEQGTQVHEQLREQPQGAPGGMNLYVEVSWVPWEESSQRSYTARPSGYRVYRSFDGANYFPVATVPASMTTLRDGTVQLNTGRRVWYAVSSVYSFGESPRTVLGSVEPLPMFTISNVNPSDGATSVSRKPAFSWRFSGLEAYNGKVTYYYDLWLYDTVLGKKYYEAFKGESSKFTTKNLDVYHNFDDFSWKRPNGEVLTELAPGRPYEWGPELIVAEWRDESRNSISVSVNCDYNAKYMDINLPPERYYLFITRGE